MYAGIQTSWTLSHWQYVYQNRAVQIYINILFLHVRKWTHMTSTYMCLQCCKCVFMSYTYSPQSVHIKVLLVFHILHKAEGGVESMSITLQHVASYDRAGALADVWLGRQCLHAPYVCSCSRRQGQEVMSALFTLSLSLISTDEYRSVCLKCMTVSSHTNSCSWSQECHVSFSTSSNLIVDHSPSHGLNDAGHHSMMLDHGQKLYIVFFIVSLAQEASECSSIKHITVVCQLV